MKYSNIGRSLVIVGLVLMMLILPFAAVGCAEVSGTTAAQLAATKVPPVDLDVYIYVDQQVPTKVPGSLTGAPMDISVQSLAVWGIVNSDTQYTISGALTFTNTADASAVFSQIPKLPNVYTRLKGSTIYFLQGSGGPAESIRSAINDNNFKNFDDKVALAEVSHLPSGGTTRPGIIGVIKPSKAAVNIVNQYLDQNTANTIDNVFTNAKPRIMAFGVFGSQPVDLADMAKRIAANTVWDLDLGAVVSMDSVYPGFIFSPIASRAISDQGFPEVRVGDISAFRDSVNTGNGKLIPIYLSVSGNHVFAVASGKDSYAQTLLTSIVR
jgi:hypothetical protein